MMNQLRFGHNNSQFRRNRLVVGVQRYFRKIVFVVVVRFLSTQHFPPVISFEEKR